MLETPGIIPSATFAGVRLLLWLPGQSKAGEKHEKTEKKGRGSPTYKYEARHQPGHFLDFPEVSLKQPSDRYFLHFTGEESEAVRLCDPSRGT